MVLKREMFCDSSESSEGVHPENLIMLQPGTASSGGHRGSTRSPVRILLRLCDDVTREVYGGLRMRLHGWSQRYAVDRAINSSMSARACTGEKGLVCLRPMHDTPLGAMCRQTVLALSAT